MGWEEDHKHRIAVFPECIKTAHKHSSDHREEIRNSESCGCFYCCSVFGPGAIVEWIDEDDEGVGQTALCPRCGIDGVIGSESGCPITAEFLTEMRKHWFDDA